jgi:hypothetical protein
VAAARERLLGKALVDAKQLAALSASGALWVPYAIDSSCTC